MGVPPRGFWGSFRAKGERSQSPCRLRVLPSTSPPPRRASCLFLSSAPSDQETSRAEETHCLQRSQHQAGKGACLSSVYFVNKNVQREEKSSSFIQGERVPEGGHYRQYPNPVSQLKKGVTSAVSVALGDGRFKPVILD